MVLVLDANEYIFAFGSVGADVLVTENRHFLSCSRNLPFKALTAEDCLKILKK